MGLPYSSAPAHPAEADGNGNANLLEKAYKTPFDPAFSSSSSSTSKNFNWRILIMALVTLLSLASFALQSPLAAALPQVASTASNNGVTITTTAGGQQFTLPAAADIGAAILPNVVDPQAKDAQQVCPGYSASNVKRNAYGFTASLSLAGKPCNVYGTDINDLNLMVQYQSADRLNVMIQPTYISASNYSHYVLPTDFVRKAGLDPDANHTVPQTDLELVWGNSPSFWFGVQRKSAGETLFSTQGTKLVFEDQFVEVKSALPPDYNMYGLGETIHALRLGTNFTKTMYAADALDFVDANIYGTHPIAYETRYYETNSNGSMSYVPWNETSLEKQYTSLSHGIYYRNAHAHEILLRPDALTWRTLGGNIDLYFYAGPTIEQVATSYQKSNVGLPIMQKYHALGYHQCRWGYKNLSQLEEVVNEMEKFQIPFENVWSDIDYMGGVRDFSSDAKSYPPDQFAAFVERLHSKGQHYIPITDSAIYHPNPANESDAYPTFDRGNEMNAFMRNPDGSLYIGAVWPGFTVFPDWLSANTSTWWTDEVTQFHKALPFDGLWIDMSEVSSFCIGSCGTELLKYNPAPGGTPTFELCQYPEGFEKTNATEAKSASSCLASEAKATPTTTMTPTDYLRTTPTPNVRNVNYPPYAINNILGELSVHAVSPNATHNDAMKTEEYDVHNLFGHSILNATYGALTTVFPGKRPLIIGRSTFAGSGSIAGHWGGDNYSRWAFMVWSISQGLSFSLFGIPMFGVDACGFAENTDEELCNRWMQLAAFFPFYRNHNTYNAISQEPYRWASVTAATKAATEIRYSMLPYMYTLMQSAHVTGSTFMRALAWEFPNSPGLANADHQFMVGSSVLVTPCLEQGADSVMGVFPQNSVNETTYWYDYRNQSAIVDPMALSGANVSIPAPLGEIPVFVKGGSVLPLQPPAGALVLRDARMKSWSVLAALDANGAASGQLYLDDGESIDPAPQDSLWIDFSVAKNMTSGGGIMYATGRGGYTEKNALANVTVMGVQSAPKTVRLNGMALAKPATFSYDTGAKRLSVTGLSQATKDGAWSKDWELDWM